MKSILGRTTKKTLLTLLIVHFSYFSFATIYYVSSAGSGANSGTDTNHTWNLAKVNATTFQPGDQILFNRGDTFYGTLNTTASGASGSPIIYGAYGTGANPIITGLTSLTSWTNLGSNIWETTSAVSTFSQLNIVVVNGVNTPMGRTPNTGYYYYQNYSGTTQITSNNLSGSPNWTGAELAFNNSDWTIKRRPITAQSGGTLTFTADPQDTYMQGGDRKFIIQNDSRTLDVQGEWYYNPSTKKLRMYSTLQPSGVSIPSVQNLFISTGKNYITVENIDFIGANQDNVVINGGNYVTIQNSTVNFSGYEGIYEGYYTATNLTISGCTVLNSNNNGIGLAETVTASTVSQNTVTNSGVIYGSNITLTNGRNGACICSGIKAEGNGNTIQYNVVTNCGYNGIRFRGTNTVVQKNYLVDCMLTLDDGGFLYTYNNSDTQFSGTKVYKNIIISSEVGSHNVLNSGIYLDGYTNHCTVSDNTITGTPTGIFITLGHDNVLRRNTVFNCDDVFRILDNYSPFSGTNNASKSNIFVAKSGQYTMHLDPVEQIKSSFVADSNYYMRPISDNTTIGGYQRTPSFQNYEWTLATWQSYSGKDIHSHKSPYSVSSDNELYLAVNSTDATANVSLPATYKEIDGTTHNSGSISLPAYSSKVLFYTGDLTGSIDNPPVINSFAIPSTSNSLTIPISSFTATDDKGVTGYALTETGTPPAVSDGIWTASAPTSYTFSSEGTKTLYAWAKDAAGNVSTSLNSVVSITLSISSPDNSSVSSPEYSLYSFEESSGTTVLDSSSLYNGNVINTASRVTGIIGNGLSLTGTGYVNLGQAYGDIQNSLTLSAWIKPDPSGSYEGVIMHGGPNVDTYAIYINYSAKSIAFRTSGATSPWLEAGNMDNLWDGSWHHVAAVYNGSTTTVYLDGSVVATQSATGTLDSGSGFNLLIGSGRDTTPASLLYSGLIDEARIYNYALNSSQIKNLATRPVISNPVTSVYFTEYKSICEGTSYNSWTTSGTYTRTLTAKSGADSIVTTYLTVNPIYTITENITINAGDSYNGWTASGQYTRTLSSVTGCDSTVITNLTVESTKINQSINLLKGYNMISTYVDADNPDVSVVTDTLKNQGMLIKVQDEAGNSYENWGSYGGWVNNIGNIKESEGYLIKVEDNCALNIMGRPVTLPIDINLTDGWNIISFPYSEQINAMSIVQPLIDQNKLVKVQDQSGNSIEDWGAFGGWINGIGNFIPGQAYKVKVNGNAVLTLQSNYTKSALVAVYSDSPTYFSPLYEGNGVDQMNINLVDLKTAGFSSGDEIAAYDNNICVGAIKLSDYNMNSGSASLIASYSTDDQNSNGFKVGDVIKLRSWNQTTGQESDLQADLLVGQNLQYEMNSSIWVKIASSNLVSGVNDLIPNIQVTVYPNPCNGKVTVHFSSLPDEGGKIEIMDMTGRIILSRLVSQSSEMFDLTSQPAGLYLVNSTVGNIKSVNKLIVR